MNPIRNIFLVDDDQTIIFLTKRIILNTGIEAKISEFGDGQEAINFLINNRDLVDLLPDVIFLDLSMPIMDGWEFLDEYIALTPKLNKKILIYIVSSSISPHDIERANQVSVVSDFIIKPLMKEKFVEIMASL